MDWNGKEKEKKATEQNETKENGKGAVKRNCGETERKEKKERKWAKLWKMKREETERLQRNGIKGTQSKWSNYSEGIKQFFSL